VSGGFVTVSGVPGKGKITSGGRFDSKSKSLLKQSKGKTVTIVVNYKGPDKVGKMSAVVFTVQ
jgi:hypothetical protein